MDSKMRLLRVLILRFLFVSFVLCACVSVPLLNCPYTVSSPQVKCSPSPDAETLSVDFLFENNMNREIESFVVSFVLYDSEGTNLIVGSENLVDTVCERVSPHDCVSVSLVVSERLFDASTERYTIDYFYIREIQYADGTVWKDPYGRFCFSDEEGE